MTRSRRRAAASFSMRAKRRDNKKVSFSACGLKQTPVMFAPIAAVCGTHPPNRARHAPLFLRHRQPTARCAQRAASMRQRGESRCTDHRLIFPARRSVTDLRGTPTPSDAASGGVFVCVGVASPQDHHAVSPHRPHPGKDCLTTRTCRFEARKRCALVWGTGDGGLCA